MMIRSWLCIAIAVGCGGKAADVLTSTTTVRDSDDRAYVADASGLVEVAPGGSRVIAKDVRWCTVDARGQVVWFTTDAGLSTFDLVDRQIHSVTGQALDSLEVIVDWGTERLGGEDLVAFDVGIALKLTAAPELEVAMGCYGDREVYCFDEKHQPVEHVRALTERARTAKLADPAYVASLARRGAARSLWSPPPLPPAMPEPPPIDRARCLEFPDRCGQLTVIPGSTLWLVETENSRGDYFHETRELWDPATGEFVRASGGKLVRSRQQPADQDPDKTDYAGLRVSVHGELSLRGDVFDGARVIYAPKEYGTTCGFTSGWRVPGPRG
jgi:hypothetical protein